MKIAINSEGSFSRRWISYCKKKNIPYKVVNAYDNDIVTQITKDCTIFMWHHNHGNYKDVLFAKQLLFSLQMAGVKTFPDFNTGWHFDDKVGQKYMFEAIGAPLVPSYVFYSEKEAKDWVKHTLFPKVFKLRGGAGASNVYLLHSKKEANKIIQKAFHSGFSTFNRTRNIIEYYRKLVQHKISFHKFCSELKRSYFSTEYAKMKGKEKGYVYFQDFIPNNTFDIRIIVINNKAFALKRMCRQGDFRASGSGSIIYNKDNIDIRCVEKSLMISMKLKNKCAAYDWVFDKENQPLIVEVSFGFSMIAYDNCPGYWDENLNWHEGKFIPQDWMIDTFLEQHE